MDDEANSSSRIVAFITASYALLSLSLLWPVISSSFQRNTFNAEGDSALPIWSNGWVAHAITHFENPFFSNTIWHPTGINLLAHTTQVGLALVFAPITWALGPIAAFNAQLFALPIVSALAMCLALRPWVKSWWSVWLAGLLWGYSSFALSAYVVGWTQLLYLATPPLVFWALSDLVKFNKRSSRTNGLFLALVVGFQILVGLEVLAITLLTSVAVLGVLFVVGYFRFRTSVMNSARRTLEAASWFALASVVVVLPTSLYALFGPAHIPQWVKDRGFFQIILTNFSEYVTRPTVPRFANWGIENGPPTPSPSFLGLTLVLSVVATIAVRRRDLLVWLLVGIGVFGIWMSRGWAAILKPWAVLWRLPVVRNVAPTRFVLVVVFAAAFLIALGIDALLTNDRLPRKPSLRWVVTAGVSLVIVAQLAVGFSDSFPIPAYGIQSDPAATAIANNSPGSSLITFPFALSPRAMVQQAGSGFKFDLVGGYGQIADFGSAQEIETRRLLGLLSIRGRPYLNSRQLALVGSTIAHWRTDDIVVPPYFYRRLHGYYHQPGAFIAVMTELYGAPNLVKGDWVWRVRGRTASSQAVSIDTWHHCLRSVYLKTPQRLPLCILSGLAP